MTEETKAKISAANKGHVVLVETRAKIAVAMMGNKHGAGRTLSPETKEKISASLMGHISSHKGIPMTEEWKAKISAAKREHPYILSPESRAKISATEKGKFVSAETGAKIGAAHWKGGMAVSRRKSHAKRRTLGFVPLNSPFEGCEGHHINDHEVVYMPKELHHSLYHNVFTGKNMEQINAMASRYLTQNGITP
jgi:tRNA U38,U39,U40 pseudouridine synthase TruA